MFFQGLCERRIKLRGTTDHNWRKDSIFHFLKFPSPFSQMAFCRKSDKSNFPKNQYKTKLYSYQTSSVLNECIKYDTIFYIFTQFRQGYFPLIYPFTHYFENLPYFEPISNSLSSLNLLKVKTECVLETEAWTSSTITLMM